MAEYYVAVEYDGYDVLLDKKIEHMSKNWDGCGFDGEIRDHGFCFSTEIAAKTFMRRVKAKFGRKVRANITLEIE